MLKERVVKGNEEATRAEIGPSAVIVGQDCVITDIHTRFLAVRF